MYDRSSKTGASNTVRRQCYNSADIFVSWQESIMLKCMTLWLGFALLCTLPASSQANPNQIAILKWYPANTITKFSVGRGPWGVAFDGSNIWVSNFSENTVSKLRA